MCSAPRQAGLTPGNSRASPRMPTGISLEVSVAWAALRRGHCAARHSSLCRVAPGSLPGPEAVVMLLHPGHQIYHSDVRRPGGYAYRNQNNSSLSSPGPGHPSSCLQNTELMQQQRWDLQDSLPSGQFGCTNSLVVLGPRSTWQRNSRSEELSRGSEAAGLTRLRLPYDPHQLQEPRLPASHCQG